MRQVQGTRVTTIITRYKTEGRPAPGTGMQIAQAHGGIISTITPAKTVVAYARGGLDVANRHLPEMTTAGSPMRVWSEPKTGGESYIPHAKDRRQRAKSITEQTAALFGGEVRWFDQVGIVEAERRFMCA